MKPDAKTIVERYRRYADWARRSGYFALDFADWKHLRGYSA